MRSVLIDSGVARRVQAAAIGHGQLLIWTIYERPTDHPAHFIARPHRATRGRVGPLPFHMAAPTLEEIRALLPPGLIMIMPQEGDDPCIVENWL